ncbi:MAG: prephenate dehydratase [Pirellulales bacterium]|jgi:chorismate mutase/prephenate dehydratase|nr:prephenate dehydratase [Pirellulales bacterium]
MAKRKPAKKKAPPPKKKQPAKRKTLPRSPSLTMLRRRIDRLDREILKLINERATLAHSIGKIKDASQRTVYAPDREEEVLSRAVELSDGPLSEQCIRAIFREIISGSRAIEKMLRVAFLGPLYSYSHLAAIHRFGQTVEFLPVGTIGSVFEEVHVGLADYGLVPVENSTDGRIADTLDNFIRYPVKISAEVQLRIHHNLLGRGARSEVKEVYSRPQALSQCRGWLSTHLPLARTIEVTSTSTAAQVASEKPGAAAIASLQAGIHYGLDPIATNIEDNQENLTRFAVISHQSAPRSGNDKTAIMFQLEHRPGTLADAMTIFKRGRVNLSWIESFPIPDSGGDYLFFIELQGHQRDVKVKRAIASLGKKSVRLDILGSYAASAPIS